MKNIKILVSFLSVMAILNACAPGNGSSNTSNSRTILTGKIENGAGKSLFINRIQGNKGLVIDTIKIADDGTFNHTLNQALKLDYYIVNIKGGKQFYLITDSTESVNFTADVSSLDAPIITGSQASSDFLELKALVENMNSKLQKYRSEIASAPSKSEKLDVALLKKAAKKSGLKEIKEFIKSNSKSAGIAAFFETMDFTVHPELAQLTINHLAKTVPHTGYYKAREKLVQKYASPQVLKLKNQDVGKPAPSIVLNDPSGKERTLYDLRGKTVLVDFWASWCGPCRRENPNLIKAYNKYNKEGFEIMSVSLDSKKESWVKAIKDDGLFWENHVSDLLKWETPYKTKYKFSSIPHAVLVDEDGAIIKVGIRGAQLEEALENIYGY